jgi:chromosome segregation ATPase
MPGLRDKLTVLVRSSLSGVLGGQGADRPPAGDLAKQIAALRAEIDRALDRDERLAHDIAAAQAEIASADRQADEALARGDEATARHIVRQMQRRQQQLAMLQAEQAQHRRSASDLIRRVNTLEALAAETRGAQPAREKGVAPRPSPAERLRQAGEEAAPTAPGVEAEFDEQAVEDDLARRRARLSL